MSDTYDFIVAGAGSAGCAVAGRLSENGRYRVLLLEAGARDTSPWIHIPLGYTRTYTDPRVNWMFDSEPEMQLNGRTLYQPRGKVLGGTRGRGNLTVETRAHATRILFEGVRAVGVEYATPHGRRTARARGEIIVSGGVYGSPQLLQLSGVGPRDLLAEFAIPVVREM